jgi:hypothetical protein
MRNRINKDRPKGKSQKKIPPTLIDAYLSAAENVGFDGRGKDGLVGYLTWLALNEPNLMSRALAKILPLEAAEKPEPAKREVYTTVEQVRARLRERGVLIPD